MNNVGIDNVGIGSKAGGSRDVSLQVKHYLKQI